MTDRREVQQFLTTVRGRLTPERAGVTMFGGERRVPGLRREEVAQLAGVSTAYYTRMERGDLAGVSEGVLLSLARALQLDDAETSHLLDLGRNSTGPARRPRTRPDLRVPESVIRLIDTMRDVPAIAANRRGDPVASNALGRALFPHLFPADAPPVNQALYMFLDPRARTFYADWEDTARATVSGMRLAAGHSPDDRALVELIGRLVVQSDEFRAWWGGHTVRVHSTGTKRIDHPIVGPITLAFDVLAITAAPEFGLTSYLAEVGTPSADALDLLRSWVVTGAPERTPS